MKNTPYLSGVSSAGFISPGLRFIKAFIVGAACWGLLPITLADWLIQRLGVAHE